MVYKEHTQNTGFPATVPGDRREAVLHLLESEGNHLSGEAVARILGISRAAVAKHVAALREAGHAIESQPRRGYRLLVRNPPLTEAALAPLLQTTVLGRTKRLFLNETASTNREAVALAAEDAPEGCLIVAEKQSGGRGRKGHAWHSSPRALQFSLILRPSFPATRIHLLTPLAVLSVAEAVERLCGLPARARQPNDVYIGAKKVAGILVETGFRGDEPDWAVVGAGINVNALPEDFPPGLERATSLFIEARHPVNRAQLLAAILERMEAWYLGLQQDDGKRLAAEWERRTAG